MSGIRLSVIIPAHNESRQITATVRAIVAAVAAVDARPAEIILVDDACSDDTVARAREAFGAMGEAADRIRLRVVYSGRRQIAATRNVGAAAARGTVLLFVDADTQVTPQSIRGVLTVVARGAVGGGARIRWSEYLGPVAEVMPEVWNILARIMDWAAGSFLFVRRDVFQRSGGFDERFFAGEEVFLSQRLKRLGRMVNLPYVVTTSPRKLQSFGHGGVVREFFSIALRPWRVLRRSTCGLWYADEGDDTDAQPCTQQREPVGRSD